MVAELRKDPTTRRWSIIATDRRKRPMDFKNSPKGSDDAACPFDEGSDDLKKATVYRHWDNPKEWYVSLLPNKYPALDYEGLPKMTTRGLYTSIQSVGGHEVFVDTPRHDADLSDMSLGELEALLDAYKERYKFWTKDERIKYVIIFKNHGVDAGASLKHPHTQLAATPVVPPRVLEELEKGERYFRVKRRCIYCDLIENEISDGKRIVDITDDFIVICPFASRFPYELMILPRRHYSNFIDMTRPELSDLAKVIKGLFMQVNNVLKDPPYNLLIHVAPQYAPNLRFYHWHIEVIPRLTEVAGFEWGTGIYINPMSPEEAAETLRSK